MRATAFARHLVTAVACTLAAACQSGTDGGGSFTISLSEQATTVGQGASKVLTITIARDNFDKPVSFVVEGLPTGVAAILPASPTTGTTVTMQLNVAGAADPATSSITVRATAEGVADQTATLGLTVTVTGSFTMSPLNSAVTVAQGGGERTSFLINRVGGFAGAVNVAVSGAPSGLTATLEAASTSGNSVLVTLAAGASLAPGSYTLTATGSYTGLSSQQTSLTVNVIGAPATSSLTMTFCSNNLPAWFAYKNEGFAWQTASPAGASFTFQATDRLAVAVTFISANQANKQTNVTFATRAELANTIGRDCTGTKSVSGSVSGLGSAHQARVVMGSAAVSPAPTSTTPNFTLSNLADRSLDLIATMGISSSGTFTPEKMIIRRSLNPAADATLPVLDFAAGEAFTLQQNTITVNNVTANDDKSLLNTLWSATSSFGAIQSASLSGSTGAFFSVPAAQLVAGDVHELYVDAYQESADVGRSLLSYYATPGDRAETIGPFLNVPLVTTVASSPYVRLRGRLDSQAEYGTAARFGFYQEPGAATDTRLVYVQVSAGYLGGTPTVWDNVVPDFTGLAGFNPGWMPTQGQTTLWQAIGFGGRAELLHDATPVPGDLLRFSDRQAFISAGNLRVVSARRALPPSQYFRR